MDFFKNKNQVCILILLLLTSFIIHCVPYVLLDISKYNFYDPDTWYYVGKIDQLKHGGPVEYNAISVLGSIIVKDTDFPRDIFNVVGG